MKRWRPESVGEMIQKEISDVIRDMKDPRIGFVTVTGVRMSVDLRYAKVYVSVMDSDEVRKETLEALTHGMGYIRREIGSRIQIRHTPELVFCYDDSIEYGTKIDKILKDLNHQGPEIKT